MPLDRIIIYFMPHNQENNSDAVILPWHFPSDKSYQRRENKKGIITLPILEKTMRIPGYVITLIITLAKERVIPRRCAYLLANQQVFSFGKYS